MEKACLLKDSATLGTIEFHLEEYLLWRRRLQHLHIYEHPDCIRQETRRATSRRPTSSTRRVSPIIPRLVNRRLGDERSMRQTQIVQQHTESLLPDGSLPDVLVPIQLRSPSSLGVIAVPHLHAIQSNRGVEML